MVDLLFTLGDWVIAANITVAILYLVFINSSNSEAKTLVLLALINALMQYWGGYLTGLFGVEETKDLVRHTWYLSFIAADLLFLCLLVSFHRNSKTTPSRFAIIVSLSFLTILGIQSARYITSVLLNLDLLLIAFLYTNAITSINICVAVYSLIILISSFNSSRKQVV
ncbi:hypothetical protein [Pseudoalteromonas maricaloris]|uniref:hypothetical protein n=1 Tax=Pseudoalteromonas maricaloris TaxID=184924 RepID=UPI00057D54CC|nr:hypothetical protein [Pseudoalteromonas flavipulchra]KID38063.1 hypothetical protein QT15_04665 [Pseudoalteromonas flavipulchra NCIMB 2033 = ATCC BAA-314]MBD0782768.1 hypothetical protein [Pseudoalteromonas flavipulchra]MBE0372356.1 hypothetical protein [Pseudoalteromonas flavipulchra NCIMB 2033 = ATCC BAA-314]